MSLKVTIDRDKLSSIVFKAISYHNQSSVELRKKAARKGLSIGKQCQFNGQAMYHEKEADILDKLFRDIVLL